MLRYGFVILFLLLNIQSLAQTGRIKGKVTDASTNEPLIGVNILVNEKENLGTTTDEYGIYEIVVPVGNYTISASMVGYKTVVRSSIIVVSDRTKVVDIELTGSAVELDQVTVSADYFDKALIENDLSTISLNSDEIKRSPGSAQDFMRILQGMAGVSFTTDQTNELLVRGGAPDENLTVFDDMEIHSTNHYPNQFNSGGPINMINVDLINDISFSTGGFIAKYGDKLSSVIDIKTREGTRTDAFNFDGNISMAGYGAVLEGGINGGKGSWLVSARNSYISLIASQVGLTSVPYYYDVQWKLAYDLSTNHLLSLTGIYGNDRIDIEGETEQTKLHLAHSSDTLDVETIDVNQHQYAVGMTLRSIWNEHLMSKITLSHNNYHQNVTVQEEYTKRNFNSMGKVESSEVLYSRDVFRVDGDDGESTLKTELIYNATDNYELQLGGALKFIRFKQLQSVDADTVRYDIDRNGIFDTTVVQPASTVLYDFKVPDHYKSYGYVNNRFSLFNDRLIVNLGLRHDYFSYSESSNFSPRVSASYYLIPDLTNITFAYGEYYQTQALPVYGDKYQTAINRYLDNSHARHFVLGFEHILSDGLKASLEGYYKSYSDLPVRETLVHLDDPTFRSQKILNIGTREVFGFDFLLQQKLVDDFFGTISISGMHSEVDDPRIGYEGETFVSEYDFPFVATIIFGKHFKNLREKLNSMPFYIKYPSMLLPFSDDMEISVRWRYASGRPYTPRYFDIYEQSREGNQDWTDGNWRVSDDLNSVRYPDYHRLDVALYSRYYFQTWSMAIFLSVQNVYNRKNVAFYSYNSDGTIDDINQFLILPVLGVEIKL